MVSKNKHCVNKISECWESSAHRLTAWADPLTCSCWKHWTEWTETLSPYLLLFLIVIAERSSNLFWTKFRLIAARSAAETERSGGPHSKTFGLLRGKQKARIFVYPVGKRSFSFGARSRFPIPIFSPPPDFVPVKLAHRPFLAEAENAGSSSRKKNGPKGKKL